MSAEVIQWIQHIQIVGNIIAVQVYIFHCRFYRFVGEKFLKLHSVPTIYNIVLCEGVSDQVNTCFVHASAFIIICDTVLTTAFV